MAARAVVSQTLGADMRSFWVRDAGRDAVAANSAQGFAADFSPSGVAVRAAAGGFRLRLSAVGYGQRLDALGAVAPVATRNRIVFSYRGLSEWFVNGPAGLEQGFTLTRPPARSTAEPLTLALQLGGSLRPRLAADGQALAFLSPAGRTALRYDGLVVRDARGHPLRASLSLLGGELLIKVADARGHFPVRIDPWVQEGGKLTGGGEKGDGEFGFSVALSADGNTALIGAPYDGHPGAGGPEQAGTGAAWVFTRSKNGPWTQQGPKLAPNNASSGAMFGTAVALSANGSTALVGAIGDTSSCPSGGSCGAAWVFTRTNGAWSQQSKLAPNDESACNNGAPQPPCADFGFSVALAADGDTALIGGPFDGQSQTAVPGAAWVFTRSGTSWSQQGAKLTASNPNESGCASYISTHGFTGSDIPCTEFGGSVALSADGNTALIGGDGDSNGAGAVWVFGRSGASWGQQSQLLSPGGDGSYFGKSVALSANGDTGLISGAVGPMDSVFTLLNGAWGHSAQLPGGPPVALSSDGNAALAAGSIYVRSGDTWTGVGSLPTPRDLSGQSALGPGEALSGDGLTALAGAPLDHDDLGAAWVFTGELYAALGDSYSAGDGAVPPSATAKNAYTSDPKCHQTPAAYPHLVAGEIGSSLIDLACTGATTATVISDQIPKIPHDASLVTITIGGNDIDLFRWLPDCLTVGHKECESKYGPKVRADLQTLPDKLDQTYRKIHEQAPEAKLLVLDYPNALPDPLPADCEDIHAKGYVEFTLFGVKVRAPAHFLVRVLHQDMPFFHNVIEAINRAISFGVERASTSAFKPAIVQMTGAVPGDLSFAGHDLCTKDPWLWGIRLGDAPDASSLHPNIAGNKAMAGLVKYVLDKLGSG